MASTGIGGGRMASLVHIPAFEEQQHSQFTIIINEKNARRQGEQRRNIDVPRLLGFENGGDGVEDGGFRVVRVGSDLVHELVNLVDQQVFLLLRIIVAVVAVVVER